MIGLFTFPVIIFIILSSGVVIFPVVASIQTDNETNDSNIQTATSQVDEYDYFKTFTDIGIPIITLLGGVLSAKFIVGSWQTRKEISDIRKEILKNYTISFKNYVTLIDTFVAKLVMEFAKLTNDKPNNKIALSEILPWGYTFNDLNYYSKKVSTNFNLRNFKGETYKEEIIKEKFEKLEDANKKCYIDFESKILDKFSDDNKEFKKIFYETRDKVLEFTASLTQYYIDDPNRTLGDEFNAMWEYMMGCYILVNKIMISKDEEEFIKLINLYNKSAEFLYDMMSNYEQKLISNKIVI